MRRSRGVLWLGIGVLVLLTQTVCDENEAVLSEGDLLRAGLAIQEERGLTLVHPFDDPMIIYRSPHPRPRPSVY